MAKKSECKSGILLDSKDLKPSLKLIIKALWESLWYIQPMIYNPLMPSKIG